MLLQQSVFQLLLQGHTLFFQGLVLTTFHRVQYKKVQINRNQPNSKLTGLIPTNRLLCTFMDWPLKIQGRFVTEADVKEIKMLLQKHSSWNRSRLSRELCARWNWRRPDGQIKDMACREFLRKLEFRDLIKLPPRQRPGPGRAPKIEPVEVNQSPISCLFWGCRLQDGIP